MQFGVHVVTIERLVRRLREPIRDADRSRSRRQRVTSRRQYMAMRLAHLRNRHVTATITVISTVCNHNRHIHPKIVRNRFREVYVWHVFFAFVYLSLVHVARIVWIVCVGLLRDDLQRDMVTVFIFTDDVSVHFFSSVRVTFDCRGY